MPSAAPPTQPTQAPGGDYNRIPYVSNAFPQTEPPRLLGLARLFSLAPPAVETARVLELGCASGGNIIPLATRFPGMQILGVDITPRHVEEGQARIRALGLDNIEIRQGDVTTLALPAAGYDCIICHGVYSWVPPEAQAAILRIAAGCLAPGGVAYISYNVFPGWQMRGVIRDLMLFHAGAEGAAPPEQRIAKARWVLENLARISHPGHSYGARLQEEAKGLATVNDAYILGEFLAPYNAPCWFREFAMAAERHGLTFLCESEVESCLPETHGAQVASLIRTMSANQLVPMEQYIDFFMGRQFRQSLLVRTADAAHINRQLKPACIRGLQMSGKLTLDGGESLGGKHVFKTPGGRTLTTLSAAVRAALDQLAAAYPETRSPEELIAATRAAGAILTAADEAAILDTLFQMVVGGLVKVSSVPVRVGRGRSRLVAYPLARADAAAGRTSTTNLKHETWTIDAVNGVLLPLLDGNSSRPKLVRQLLAAIESGRLNMTSDRTGIPLGGEALEKAASEHVDLAIARLADAALLMPEAVQASAVASRQRVKGA